MDKHLQLILHYGGACHKCGYNKNISALKLDPHPGGSGLERIGLDKLKEKPRKVICLNCEQEEDMPCCNLTNLQMKYCP